MDARARQISSSLSLLLLALSCNLVGSAGLRLLVWTPLLFFAPGYLLADLVFKRDRLAAMLMGVVLSICMNIVGGMALGYLGYITSFGWSLWFCILFIGCLHLHMAFSADIERVAPAPIAPEPIGAMNSSLVSSLCASVLILGGAYWIAIESEASDSQFSFIEFSMLPSDAPSQLTLTISNEELGAQAFRIEVSTDGVTTAVWSTDVVQPGQKVQFPVVVAPTARRIVARLFRRDVPNHIIRLVSRDLTQQLSGERMGREESSGTLFRLQ